jgi:hypothetical protein
MFTGDDWVSDWRKAEVFSLRIGEICALIPLRGSWEPNDRIAFAMASFRLAQEHHRSTHLLFSNDGCSSARALARPLMEAALRSVWLLEEASERDIIELAKGRERLPLLGDLNRLLIKQLEERPLRGKLLGTLDSFTPGGAAALSAQFIEGAELEKRSSAIVALAGLALAAAGYAVARLLRRDALLIVLSEAVPTME